MQEEKEFSITTERRDHCIVLHVRGDLDELTAGTLDDTLTSFDDEPVIVDLTDTTFICSASLHVLTKHRPWGRPALVVPQSNFIRVLGIIGADRTNEIFADQQTAIRGLGLGHLTRVGGRR